MTESPPLTTAEALGKYRAELLDQGFSAEQAYDLVQDAASTLVRDCGLGVK